MFWAICDNILSWKLLLTNSMVPVSMKGMRYKYTFILSPHESTDIKLNHNMNMNKNHFRMTLLWRINGRDSVSNHQPHDCLLNRLFRRRSKNTSKLFVTGLCAGNSPGTGEFPAQMASNAENVSIWWRHHGIHETQAARVMGYWCNLIFQNWFAITRCIGNIDVWFCHGFCGIATLQLYLTEHPTSYSLELYIMALMNNYIDSFLGYTSSFILNSNTYGCVITSLTDMFVIK